MQNHSLYTVIVADDEDELREALCRMIPWEQLGFRLLGSAENGLDALELVEQMEPDLLLTDIRMPFISGIELARQVREIRPSIHIAFLSGFDDFEYAKQAIQYNIISYMLKPVTLDGISTELTRIREKIDEQFDAMQERTQQQTERESFLMSLLLDGYASAIPEESEQNLKGYAVEKKLLRDKDDCPQMQVMITRMTDEAEGRICTRPDHVRMVEMIAAKYLRQASFFSCGKVVTVLSGNPSDFEEYLHILTIELVETAERVLRIKCTIGVSEPVFSLGRLHTAYRMAADALSYSPSADSGVEYISDMQPTALTGADHLNELVDEVKERLRDGNIEQMKKALDELLSAGNGEAYGKNWLDLAALMLISGVDQTLYQSAGGEAMAELQSHVQEMPLTFRYRSLDELKASLGNFCRAAIELMKSQRKKGSGIICQQALDAIDRCYKDESLSLVSLSGILHVSPNHLSACLKKDTGETFINILIKKRMEVARGMLLGTDLKILDIAKECGYSDQHYFSYCFKKYCGVSPLALRRSENGKGGTVS